MSEARFQLNGTDIEEDDKIAVTLSNGSLLLLLTQEKEGFFTCSYNMSTSANSIGLAGMSNIDAKIATPPYYPQLSQAHVFPLMCYT